MTCFWQGLMKGLTEDDFNNIGETKTNMKGLINILKKKNKKTKNVIWNKKTIPEKELEENYIAVKDYNINNIGNGHLCSTGDYMLLLVCDIFNINIDHKYLQKTMTYEKKTNCNKIFVQSDKGHFWFVKRI